VALATASNSHEWNSFTGIAHNFVEKIAICLPHDFTPITYTIAPADVSY
jgi:hypothetical protein